MLEKKEFGNQYSGYRRFESSIKISGQDSCLSRKQTGLHFPEIQAHITFTEHYGLDIKCPPRLMC
jgi:hypothetical protein